MLHWPTLPGGPSKKYGLGLMAVHEMGHAFGLYHPYEGGCLENLQDDKVADTPRMKGNIRPNKCPGPGFDSCPKLPGKDDTSNFMLAVLDECRTHFTPGQVQRMLGVMAKYGVF